MRSVYKCSLTTKHKGDQCDENRADDRHDEFRSIYHFRSPFELILRLTNFDEGGPHARRQEASKNSSGILKHASKIRRAQKVQLKGRLIRGNVFPLRMICQELKALSSCRALVRRAMASFSF